MSTQQQNGAQQRTSGNTNLATQRPTGKAGQFLSYIENHKDQLAMALPKHLNADRMSRLALTCFNSNRQLQECDPKSVFASVVLASQMGLEIGVRGAGYLVPYKGKATFVPGWMGIVDLVSRTGRASVWTGAVYEGDHFSYSLGDKPFIEHRPGDGETDDPSKLLFVYAVGRVNGAEWPVIEVWSNAKVRRHFKKYNKVGEKHYAHTNWEMYARKVPLLQVCKYMPSSVELTAAINADHAHEQGKGMVFDGEFSHVVDDGDQAPDDAGNAGAGNGGAEKPQLPTLSDAEFEAGYDTWAKLIEGGKKTAADVLAMIGSKHSLSEQQRKAIEGVKAPTKQ